MLFKERIKLVYSVIPMFGGRMEFIIKIKEYFLIPLGKGKMMGRIVIIFAFLKAFMMVICKVLKFICPCSQNSRKQTLAGFFLLLSLHHASKCHIQAGHSGW